MRSRPSRRELMQVGLATLAASSARTAAAGSWPPVCIFSKHLQFYGVGEVGKAAKALGVDGLDLTVRDRGHVLPGNVTQDLPAAVAAIRDSGIEAPMITTALMSGSDPHAAPILQTAASLGITYARIGGHRYTAAVSPLDELKKVEADLRSLARIAEDNGIVLGYHNHSGFDYVGGPLWDLLRVFDAVASPNLGFNFDAGHATAEGAAGAWKTTARTLAPHVKMMAVKDFVWDGSKPKWVPLGNGVVRITEMLMTMRSAGFAGPISIHFEYDVPGNDALLKDMAGAVTTLRGSIVDAGYPV